MSVTIVETPTLKATTIAVRPYVDEAIHNMGLEKYKMALYDGVLHEEYLACIEMNGVKRYVTGLNEFAPEIKLLPKEQREAKSRQIREMVAELEKELAANILDVEDKEFWNKVKLLRPDNSEFWDKINMRCGNEPVFLDPVKSPYDRIKLCAIEVGGFDMISKSYDEARKKAVPPKFYLDKLEATISTRMEITKLRNSAVAELEKLFAKNMSKLFYIAKVVDANSIQYKRRTPNDVIYENLDRYIRGEGAEKSKTRAINTFLEATKMDMETLKIRAIIKDSTYLKLVHLKGDGMIYHLASSTMMGRNPSELTEFLKNPLNEKELAKLTSDVEKFWNE